MYFTRGVNIREDMRSLRRVVTHRGYFLNHSLPLRFMFAILGAFVPMSTPPWNVSITMRVFVNVFVSIL